MRYRISSIGYRKLLVFIWTACNNYAYTDRRAWRNYCCCCVFFIVRKESVFNAEKLYAGICISTGGWRNSQAYRIYIKRNIHYRIIRSIAYDAGILQGLWIERNLVCNISFNISIL